MKRKKKIGIALGIVIAVALIFAGILFVLSKDPVLNMNDVYSTINTVLPYFIPFVLVAVVAFILTFVFEKKSKKFRFMFAAQSFAVVTLIFVVTVNAVIFGPLQTVISLALTTSTGLSDETAKKSKDVNIKIAEEGTVLLKNEEETLPLNSDVTKLNVFGWASTSPVYGGTGSGSVDTSTSIDILTGLTDAGYELNKELTDFYREYCAERPGAGQWIPEKTLPEPSVDKYSDELIQNAKDFSDYAVVVLARIGGEDCDLPKDMSEVTDYNGNKGDFTSGQSYLELSKSEKDMIEMVNDNFDHVIVVVNAANAMELGWVNEYDSIKSVLWMAGAGQNGFEALGEILKGDVNPSGKLVDTYAYDVTSGPSFANVGSFTYDNMEDYQYEDSTVNFVNYVEGIYVGYRFYETYYLDDEEGYRNAILYPFGYGLSYTTFEQQMSELKTDAEGNISVDVIVTNTGNVAGKDVVELYYSAPYTEGGIEKSAVDLATFEKTKLLEPGESETVTVTLNEEDMASYDTYGKGCYVLEQGDYQISLRTDSHTVVDTKTYNVPETVVYDENNKRSTDEVAATNKFANFTEGNVEYLSRANHFENLESATAAPTDFSMAEEYQKTFRNNRNYKITSDVNDEMPVTGAKNDVKLQDLRGKKFDDPMWNDLLDELTVSDMENLIVFGGYQTSAVSSIDKVATIDADGPAGFSSFFNDALNGTAFPCATMIAATWNKDLATDRGNAIAEEANELGITGWYGPGMNIHRSPFSGRNFEYYSEDPVLTGKMAAAEVAAAQGKGIICYIKHFALNDQETNRGGICTWSNEQAIREIYLKPFEMAVEEGGATGVMTAVNFLGGTEWCGASTELMQDVLRGEWGFHGVAVTDFFGGPQFQNSDIGIRSGTDLMLSTTGENHAALTDTKSATAVTAMRNATHDILYAVVNSNAYENYEGGINLQGWEKIAIAVDVVLGLLLVVSEILIVKHYKKKTVVTEE